jgi:hypothetical protein
MCGSDDQVLDASGTGASANMDQGLILALWDAAGYSVVDASFTIMRRPTAGRRSRRRSPT